MLIINLLFGVFLCKNVTQKQKICKFAYDCGINGSCSLVEKDYECKNASELITFLLCFSLGGLGVELFH